MKNILCYGDSNTYGYNPQNGLRYPKDVRWPGYLQLLLNNAPDAYTVIEEGCNGRTTVTEDPNEPWKNGLDYLKPCLNSHKPLDIVILMLGTNDLKEYFHKTASQIATDAGVLVDNIKSFTASKQGYIPTVILVSPPQVGEDMPNSPFSNSFSPRSLAESKSFAKYFKAVAEEKGCIFFDAASCVEASKEDSLHLTASGHMALAEALYQVISTL